MPRITKPFAVTPVRDRTELRRFLDVPWRVHRDEQRWMAPIRSDVARRLRSGPVFEDVDVVYFLAWRGSEAVGRISVQVAPGEALFGFFETEPDEETARHLVEAAAAHAADSGAGAINGPCSFTTVEEAGVLVEGFEEPTPAFQPPWYAELLEAAGCEPVADLVTARLDLPAGSGAAPPRSKLREVERAVTEWAPTLDMLVRGLPGAWPPTPDDARARFRLLRPSLDPTLVVLADGAVAVGVPVRTDLMTGLRSSANPVGALRAARRRPRGAALAFLGGESHEAARDAMTALLQSAADAGYAWLDVTSGDPSPLGMTGRVVHRRRILRRPVEAQARRPAAA